MNYATTIPWDTRVKGTCYGTDHTYELAAEWLHRCSHVADWGGARGHFRRFLHPHIEQVNRDPYYYVVDGTRQEQYRSDHPVLVASLKDYTGESDGILLRHVLEMTEDWRRVLENAIQAFSRRMVIVTFTPNVKVTHIATYHLSWPVHHFNHLEDLIPRMLPYLKKIDAIQAKPKLPERVYYLEKP